MASREADYLLRANPSADGHVYSFQKAVRRPQPIAMMDRHRKHPGDETCERHCAVRSRIHRCSRRDFEVNAIVRGGLTRSESARHRSLHRASERGAAHRSDEKDG